MAGRCGSLEEACVTPPVYNVGIVTGRRRIGGDGRVVVNGAVVAVAGTR